jgi:hypothetical protein
MEINEDTFYKRIDNEYYTLIRKDKTIIHFINEPNNYFINISKNTVIPPTDYYIYDNLSVKISKEEFYNKLNIILNFLTQQFNN